MANKQGTGGSGSTGGGNKSGTTPGSGGNKSGGFANDGKTGTTRSNPNAGVPTNSGGPRSTDGGSKKK